MPDRGTTTGSERTMLELRIRERRQTFEEFVEYAETFAREHGEPGTLSLRHLQRLVASHRRGANPPGPLRPATARLLEHIFDTKIEQLLAPATEELEGSSAEATTDQLAAQSKVHALRVAVAVVVKHSDVLIVRRRGNDGCGITWQFPAGMVKPGIPVETVAIHETYDETRIHCAVARKLGSRVHPVTSVICHYLLCEYLGGDEENIDVVENAGVAWADKKMLTRFIPIGQIFPPVLEALELSK